MKDLERRLERLERQTIERSSISSAVLQDLVDTLTEMLEEGVEGVKPENVAAIKALLENGSATKKPDLSGAPPLINNW